MPFVRGDGDACRRARRPPVVMLDRTAFYPTSGGQPFDTGRLGSVAVIETIDDGDDIVHVVSAPRRAGTRVRGEIDWVRRFDHMQQHTGQHVLSAAFDRLFENRTTSFHMGAEVSTIDLTREATSADLERAVDEANRVVWENREVSVRFVSADEAARLPLRKEPIREGILRLVEISDFDLSACGGTHVSRTGAIGIIAATSRALPRRLEADLRVWRARRAGVSKLSGRRHRSRSRVVGVAARAPSAIERAQLESKELRKTVSRLQGSWLDTKPPVCWKAPPWLDRRVVVQALEGWDAAGLKAIASALWLRVALSQCSCR